MKTLQERFESKFVRGADCWEWVGARTGGGYGSIKVNGKASPAHRVSFGLYISEIPNGLHVLHACDNPSCVNPSHLFLGAYLDNMRDMYSKNRRSAATGSRNGATKLNEESVLKIRRDARPSNKVAADYGVSSGLVRQIRRGLIWAAPTSL